MAKKSAKKTPPAAPVAKKKLAKMKAPAAKTKANLPAFGGRKGPSLGAGMGAGGFGQ